MCRVHSYWVLRPTVYRLYSMYLSCKHQCQSQPNRHVHGGRVYERTWDRSSRVICPCSITKPSLFSARVSAMRCRAWTKVLKTITFWGPSGRFCASCTATTHMRHNTLTNMKGRCSGAKGSYCIANGRYCGAEGRCVVQKAAFAVQKANEHSPAK